MSAPSKQCGDAINQGWKSESLAALPNDGRYLIGVSGGRDSVVLLHWLLARGYHKLIVCHLEHGLRDRAGRADADFVERLAQKYGLRFERGAADVRTLALARKQSIETTARRERLAFFTKIARRRRCRILFLAHHADDQVETFLMNLFRGAGGRGLGAMREVSSLGSLQIVRPLLGIWRAEIDAYVAEHRLKFREDASNAELGARRNRVRHTIVPDLEKQFGRNLREILWRAASLLAEEDALLDALLPNEAGTNETLAVPALLSLPLPLQRRAILRWLRARALGGIGFEAVEKVRSLLAPDGGIAKVNLPGDRHARRRAGKVFIE
ncbi:MAG: tRNA lysidine(34) synthetase TilS [Chthoniobacterales bacterium]|nr:tRNA lysidine(34) synthetase TilS [Chthoniobacterales bacterium]